MSKLKTAITALAIGGTIAGISVSSVPNTEYPVDSAPCPKDQVQVWVNRETACVYDTFHNRKAAMLAEITAAKKDASGNDYDIELSNWNVFWKTLSEAANENGITSEQLNSIVKNSKQEIIRLLKPNR